MEAVAATVLVREVVYKAASTVHEGMVAAVAVHRWILQKVVEGEHVKRVVAVAASGVAAGGVLAMDAGELESLVYDKEV